ncbi:MAG: hypothetical protein DRH24_02830 [Deltaproteobacteria bacterium]|nr:MAG: hypothetical protein DRH24_02830 [Deltaproteobacteria bacterium]
MIFQSSLGINITDDLVSIVFLKNSFKGAEPKAHEVYNLEKERPLKERLNRVGDLVNDFMERYGIVSTNIFLGIPGELTILKEIEFPLVVKENLKETLAFEMEKYVPLSADDMYFDFQIISEDKKNNRLKVLVIVAKKKAIDPYFDLKDRISVGISGIETGSTAVADFFLHKNNAAENTFAIAYQKDKSLEINLIKKRFLIYSRRAEIAGDYDDTKNQIKEALKPLKAAAGKDDERIRLAFYGFDTDREIYNIIKEESGLYVNFIDFSEISSNMGVPSPELVPAFGLALKGLCKVQMQMNLFPEKFRKRPNKILYYMMFVLIGLVILSAISWGGSNILHQRLLLNRLDTQISDLLTRVADIDQIRSELKKIEERIDYLNGLEKDYVSALDILKELSSNIPETAWVQSFSFKDKSITLDGYAEAASELIPVLETSPLFYDVVFLSTITKGKDGKERFKIGVKIK